MRHRLISNAAIVLLAISLQACTHTMVLSSTAPPREYDRVNRSFADRSAKVRFANRGIFDTYNVRFEPDSVRFTSPMEERVAVPAESFISAEYRDRTRGALDGALIGGIGFSLLAGVGAVALSGGSSSNSFFGPCRDSCVAEAFLGAGIAGALTGMIIGAVRGSRVKVVRRPGGPAAGFKAIEVVRRPAGPAAGFKAIEVAPVTVGVTTDALDATALAQVRLAIVDALRATNRYELVTSELGTASGVLRVSCRIDEFDNGSRASRLLLFGLGGRAHLHTSCRFEDAGDGRLYAVGAFTADYGGDSFGSTVPAEEMAKDIGVAIARFLENGG